MEKCELAMLIINILDEIIDNTKTIEYKNIINLRKWVIVNIIYNYEDAEYFLTKYWKYNIFHDNFNRCLSAEKLIDTKINMLLISKLDGYSKRDKELQKVLTLIKKVLDNFEENLFVLRSDRFFCDHECIKKSLKLVDNN